MKTLTLLVLVLSICSQLRGQESDKGFIAIVNPASPQQAKTLEEMNIEEIKELFSNEVQVTDQDLINEIKKRFKKKDHDCLEYQKLLMGVSEEEYVFNIIKTWLSNTKQEKEVLINFFLTCKHESYINLIWTKINNENTEFYYKIIKKFGPLEKDKKSSDILMQKVLSMPLNDRYFAYLLSNCPSTYRNSVYQKFRKNRTSRAEFIILSGLDYEEDSIFSAFPTGCMEDNFKDFLRKIIKEEINYFPDQWKQPKLQIKERNSLVLFGILQNMFISMYYSYKIKNFLSNELYDREWVKELHLTDEKFSERKFEYKIIKRAIMKTNHSWGAIIYNSAKKQGAKKLCQSIKKLRNEGW